MMGPAISHLIQTFRFAHDLKARSHVVTVASPESYLKPIVESNGLPFYHLNLYDDLSLPPSDRWRRQHGESQAVWKRLLPQPRLRARTERQQLFRSLFEGSAHRSMMDALRPDRLARFRLSAGLSYRQVLRLLEHHGISAGEPLGTPELILCPAAFDFPRAANPGGSPPQIIVLESSADWDAT